MKSATVAFGLFAGLSSAYGHHGHLHAPYVRRNETLPTPSTTLTVAITSVHTITSCAPTITNCPVNAGNSTGPVVVTEVIDLTTVVCPVTEATSISSSVVDAHSSGLVTGTTHILTSTDNSPAETPAPSSGAGLTVYPTVGTSDATLTMTIGPEGSQSVSVTTIHSTFTQIVTVITSPLPSSGSGNSGNSGNSGGSGSGGSDNGDVTSQEGTTTTTITTTSTRTVTVPGSTSTSTVIGSGSDSGSGTPPVSGEAECSPVTVTVTEAAPASTVYVTVGGNSAGYPTGIKVPTDVGAAATPTSSTDASPTGTNGGNSGNGGNGGNSGNGGNGGDETGNDDECPPEETDDADDDECPPEETGGDVTATTTATVIPTSFPAPSSFPAPTGYPVPTGYPTFQRRHALY
ncbi:putative lustrin a-like protein [Rosellinia necatrix]|uniref:Putative lustrin a-like protein n=1 Tax=Rosellinia necatrix TaxID=77044 RepID=A0A1W2TRB0_ROSNE|nr:putative lustrin a-like protein [Rosellinia necatrix]